MVAILLVMIARVSIVESAARMVAVDVSPTRIVVADVSPRMKVSLPLPNKLAGVIVRIAIELVIDGGGIYIGYLGTDAVTGTG